MFAPVLAVALLTADISSAKPPPGLALALSKCLVVKASTSFTYPNRLVLLSEDGMSAFRPWSFFISDGAISSFELASEARTDSRIYLFHAADRPWIATWRQVKNIEPLSDKRFGGGTRAAVAKLLSSPRFDTITLLHTASADEKMTGPEHESSVSTLNIGAADPTKNKLLDTGLKIHTESGVQDRGSVTLLVKGFDDKWRLRVGRKTKAILRIPGDAWPLHLDIAADKLVLTRFETRVGYANLEIWSIKHGRRTALLKPPPGLPKSTFVWQTALLPGGRLLASFGAEAGDAALPFTYGLYEAKLERPAWKRLGSFRLEGMSNSGKVLMISGPRGTVGHYLLWPK